MNEKKMMIVRAGTFDGEKWVTLHSGLQQYNGKRFDPQLEYFLATGILLPRENCIASFIDGLMETGWNVVIHDHRRRYWQRPPMKPRTVIAHRSLRPIVSEFQMVGRLYGLGMWTAFKKHMYLSRTRPNFMVKP